MIDMEIAIILLSTILTYIYISYIFAKSKLNETYYLTDVIDENINNFFAVATLLSLNLFMINNLFKTIILNNLLTTFLCSFIVLIMLIIFIVSVSHYVSHKFDKRIEKLFRLFNSVSYILYYPFILIYQLCKKLFFYKEDEKMSEDEFLDMIEQAEELDGITESESKLIKSVLDFDELKVTDIYTPRIDVIAVNKDDSITNIKNVFITSGYSRLPLYEDEIDNIIGVLNYKDFFTKVILEQNDLSKIIQKPVEVTEYMKVNNLLSLLKVNQSHMAIVKDEFGGTLGIVTMEDVLEELVGDIFDEHDVVVENISQIAENKYLIKGSTYLDELIETLNIDENVFKEDYLTVNGWVVNNLETVGKKGDSFEYNNLKVIVTKANSKQVLEIELTIINKIETLD